MGTLLSGHCDSEREYKTLGCAIVQQAVKEYKNLPYMESAYRREVWKKDIERFFYSDWCFFLCGVDRKVWDEFLERNKPGLIERKETE